MQEGEKGRRRILPVRSGDRSYRLVITGKAVPVAIASSLSCRDDDSRHDPFRGARLPGPVRDPEEVPSRIQDPEIRQAPRAVLEILPERPPRRDNPIALTGHIVDLENQLYPGRRQSRGAGMGARQFCR